MKLSEFDFDLPEALIAQTPLEKRDHSRLMVVNRQKQTIEDKHFYDIVDYLHEGDVLVRNNTKVIPARLYGTKTATNGHVEVLLLKDLGNNVWECLVGNAKIVKVDTLISFGDGQLQAKCIKVKDEGIRIFEMLYEGIFRFRMHRQSLSPYPPEYQMIYPPVSSSVREGHI